MYIQLYIIFVYNAQYEIWYTNTPQTKFELHNIIVFYSQTANSQTKISTISTPLNFFTLSMVVVL